MALNTPKCNHVFKYIFSLMLSLHSHFMCKFFLVLLSKNHVVGVAGGILTVLEKKAAIQTWKHVQRSSWLHWILKSMFIGTGITLPYVALHYHLNYVFSYSAIHCIQLQVCNKFLSCLVCVICFIDEH